MHYAADLHIHSHYSRATSRNLTFEGLACWAQLKGLGVIGTGDVSHPGWLAEMRTLLEPAEDGLFRLRAEYASPVEARVPPACRAPVRFLLGGEISNIYRRDEATRKVHSVVFLPSFEAVERLQGRLERVGNIRSDGRPILGLDVRDLLQMVLEADPAGCLIPAHIWTPWFSLLGSKSGFDSVEACFGDLTPHIFALETGLSSDPPMNWQVSFLDRYTLVSNSDAHSSEKLGREATLFAGEPSYAGLFDALRSGDPARCRGTIEFFPEEGKYHYDGHRACGVVWEPAMTRAHAGVCPVCSKPVTVGVMHRVAELADRPAGARPQQAQPYQSLVPLREVLGEVYAVGSSSRQVEAEYMRLLGRLGPELAILADVPVEELRAAGAPRLAEGIEAMRAGRVQAQPGYDGEYGVIRVLTEARRGSNPAPEGQIGLFGDGSEDHPAQPGLAIPHMPTAQPGSQPAAGDSPVSGEALLTEWAQDSLFDMPGQIAPTQAADLTAADLPDLAALLAGLNAEQVAAVRCTDLSLAVVAGPGTGKTRTLTVRIAYLVRHLRVAPESILAITFTNKAAGEMAGRLMDLLGPELAGRVTVRTFHAFGAGLLRAHAKDAGLQPDFAIYTNEERASLLRRLAPNLTQAEAGRALAEISGLKGDLAPCGDRPLFLAYEATLSEAGALDYDDLVVRAVRLLEGRPDVLEQVRARYRWISVDEYQDVNHAQYRLLRLLAGDGPGGANVCAIGDPDQAIYGFRGASPTYFAAFAADWPGSHTVRLQRNYRSTQTILDAAGQVIARGDAAGGEERRLLAVEALAGFAAQVKLEIRRAATERAEAESVVQTIEQMLGGVSHFSVDSGRAGDAAPGDRTFADFAVLYRLSVQSRPLVEAFERSGMPYQTSGETPLCEQKIVRRALSHLWLLVSPVSAAHLEMGLSGKPGMPPAVLAAVGERLAGQPQPDLAEALEWAAADRVSAGQRKRLLWARDLQRDLAAARGAAVSHLVEMVAVALDAGSAPLDASGTERLARLARRAALYGSDLVGFLESTALGSEVDDYDPQADRVALMTLHAAKGLEFRVVFIVGCEEGLLPYERDGAVADLEEERRLFYVGLTRARERLILSSAASQMLFGQRVSRPASRFVDDIAAALKEARESRTRPPAPRDRQLSLF